MIGATDTPLRITIAGAGAIGCTLAARLALSGTQVNLLARGNTLAHIREHGVCLTDLEGTHVAHVNVGDGADFGPQDVIFLCAKAQDLIGLVTPLLPLIDAQTTIVPVVNGIPWWYFENHEGRHAGRIVKAVDPDGRLKALIPGERIVGTVAYITAEKLATGVVRTANPLRMIIGELHNSITPRVQRIQAVLEQSGIATQISERIRDALWTKVIANLTSNPLSVVSGGTLNDIYGDPELMKVTRQMLDEVLLTAASFGARIDLDPTSFMAMGAGMGEVRTSMLQDYDNGLPLELTSIGDAVVELASLHDLALPATTTILTLARFRSALSRKKLSQQKEKA
ncbi:ketopantoate reductase family protein [Azonexus sp. IMCC34842]|uniref:ketopantoate reductase family protein n=1 Tax=Azonexus sp. IMCC34842 TaxID=3420950 RepID=UPI003D0BE236